MSVKDGECELRESWGNTMSRSCFVVVITYITEGIAGAQNVQYMSSRLRNMGEFTTGIQIYLRDWYLK